MAFGARTLVLAAILLHASSFSAQTTGRITVDNIRYWEAPNSVRIVVDVSAPANIRQGEARSPDRAFVDISPARLSPSLVGKEWPVGSGPLLKIRAGQFDPSTVRIVLDLGAMKKVTSFMLRDPDRLIIDAELTDVAQAAPKSNEAALVVTPAKPTNRGDQSLVRSLGLKLSRVVIDAGHGGHDTGGIGPTGYLEKDLVLDLAKRLKELVENGLGAEVVLTRGDDTFVPLEARTAVANQQQADLFISIHANSSRTRSVRGVETFYLGLTTAREALETVARENAASERSIHELQDVVKQIMTQEKVSESRELADHIQKSLAKDGRNRGVKQAHFLVLIGANMPAVLAEINFITNPQEERQLKTVKYRQQIAEALFAGVRSYSNTLSGLKTAKSQGK